MSPTALRESVRSMRGTCWFQAETRTNPAWRAAR